MNLLLAQMDDPQNHLHGFPDPNILRNIAKLDVRGTVQNGNTQLHLVLCNLKLNENVVKELLDLDAPVNAENNSGQTPLHYALLYQNEELLPIIKLLVRKKASVNKYDKDGFGPLEYALMNANCSTDVIKFLCDRGADVNVVDMSGCTLLHHASSTSSRKLSLEVIKILLDKGVSAHTVNMQGETALHRAVHYNRKEVVELLLKIPKIKVNLFNKQCFTPLHLAVRDPNTDPGIIKLLLKAGAIIHKKSLQEEQCLHLAAYHCNPTHIKILLDYGARVNVYDKNNLSPLDIAVSNSQSSNVDALKLLLDALIFHEKPKRKMNHQDKNLINASNAFYKTVRGLKRTGFKAPPITQPILLLLKYALLENPRMCIQRMDTYSKIKLKLTDYKEKCMEELKTVCIAPKVTLVEFILQSSRQKNRECPTNDILEILSARPYPIYKEVVAGIMNRDDLREGLQQHPVYALNDNKPDERAVLDNDTLSDVMIYLSDEDLLNLLLAVFEPRRSPVPQVNRCCDCFMNDDIEIECEKFHKRARYTLGGSTFSS